MTQAVIGIDLGATAIKSAVVSADKEIIAQESRPTEADKGLQVVLDNMRDAYKALSSENIDIVAAGIGAPGPLDYKSGVVFSPPNLPGWKDVPLADEMEQRLGIPCFIDNDGNLATYGEFWMGAGQGANTLCALTLGTGVGGGIIVNGELHRGIDGTAGEIGHLKVMRDGRTCGCGAQGCLEAYGSVSGMVKTAQEGLKRGAQTALLEEAGGDVRKITGSQISALANQGDAFCQEVLTETATWLGIGISSLINLFNPEKIVLCGGMIAAGDQLTTPIRETALSQSFPVPANRCQIVTAQLGNDAGVLGAAGAAWRRYEDSVR
jgi:glucokinase